MNRKQAARNPVAIDAIYKYVEWHNKYTYPDVSANPSLQLDPDEYVRDATVDFDDESPIDRVIVMTIGPNDEGGPARLIAYVSTPYESKPRVNSLTLLYDTLTTAVYDYEKGFIPVPTP